MKLRFIVLETKTPDWVDTARSEYVEKIRRFCSFEVVRLKVPAADRDDAAFKKKMEADVLLRHLEPKDLTILLSEDGREFKSSEDFSSHLAKVLESGKARINFCIGGAYGFDPAVIQASQQRWSLSRLTLNHWLAQIVALEQLYRGFTLIKNIPYHNR